MPVSRSTPVGPSIATTGTSRSSIRSSSAAIGGAGRAARAGAEERVHHEADARPRPVGRHLAHALGARAGGHRLTQLGRRTRRRGHPHRHLQPVERAGQHPSVAAVVAGAGGDQHAVTQPVGVAGGEHPGRGAARALHQGGERDAPATAVASQAADCSGDRTGMAASAAAAAGPPSYL